MFFQDTTDSWGDSIENFRNPTPQMPENNPKLTGLLPLFRQMRIFNKGLAMISYGIAPVTPDVCQWPKRPPSRAPVAPAFGRNPSDSSPRPPDVCRLPGEELHRARNYPVAGASGAQYHPRRGEELGHWPGEDVCQWPKRPPSRAPEAPAFGRYPSDSSPRPPDVCHWPGEELHRARNYPVAGASGAQYHPRRGEDLGHCTGRGCMPVA